MNNVGLVLEGGGMRGIYTAGVLEFFLEQQLHFPYVVGASAGASMACSYLARQKGRNKKVNIGLIKDSRFISFRNILRERSLFGMNFLFDEVPKSIIPLNVEQVLNNDQLFQVATTCMTTGKAVYHSNDGNCDILQAVKASSSLPLLSPYVTIDGKKLMDGGVADPIPLAQARHAGFKKNVVVLTRERGFRKKQSPLSPLAPRIYKEYPEFATTMMHRTDFYNEQLDWIDELEARDEIKVLRPPYEINVKRTEKDPKKLLRLYEAGYRHAKELWPELQHWHEEPTIEQVTQHEPQPV
ncbi:patatin-like phospholipase family protein [Salsuginibacillus kocurii]|uniref:patatin-like phospholipase family protein n=1 Tax=Salsuginibacillus kocurii TaxID=427078 RepID=UPI00037BC3C2|nr:patatin family protein [Salsuginibacillus kocurii]